MKPSDLQPLVGRTVQLYYDGLRTGTVRAAPASNTLTVELLGPHGRHRVPLEKVRGVFWRKRLETIEQYLARRAGGAA